jgi:molybdopterin converting factor small subunit
MKINILYFAQIAEKLGFASEEFEIPENMGSEALVDKLRVKYPELNDLSFTVSVNQIVVHSDTGLEEGFEIALLPPFAGG